MYSDFEDFLEGEIVFGELFTMLGALFLLIFLILVAFVVTLYIFQGIALQQLGKKNNIEYSWLAWVPVANSYLLGKLGFEIYAPKDKKNEVFTWILLGCSVVPFVFGDVLGGFVSIASIVFTTWAYYYIFNKIDNKNCILFTVLTAIFSIGPVLLFFNRKKIVSADSNVEEVKQQTESKEKFCSSCGNKLNLDSKFCSKCGSKI